MEDNKEKLSEQDMISCDPAKQHRIKSFVVRAGRMTAGQIRAIEELGPKYMVDVEKLEPINTDEVFGRSAPLVVEIGFGMGVSFVQMAKEAPEYNFLGIEVHPPGVGSALKLIDQEQLTNVRIIQFDAFEVLSKCLAPKSVDVLQIFFPDPWPKKRHIKRRLINDDFVKLVAPLFKSGGQFRMATDWEDYAVQMLDVMTRAEGFTNTSVDGTYIPRPSWRPLTKFEQRGQRLGHGVWDLVFKRD
ncbi:MAG: tRNA (guanosine(46)-N7)-methyltransferase TrmB [Succinivibrio sp.]